MPVEFIGMISTREQSEIHPSTGPAIDRAFVRAFAQAHEDAGFDKVLIGYSAGRPDGMQVAAYAAAHTQRLHFLIAHRPGFVFPTLAARSFATLDQFTEGRVALHAITGGNDAEQRREGDYLSKDERYARTDEYLDILEKSWTSSAPFSYAGTYYRLENFAPEVRPFQQPRIPIYFGGSSEAAYQVGAKHADVYALWGEPLAATATQIAAVRAEAAKHGRSPRFSVSFRPILGATEELAWARAEHILAMVQDSVRGSQGQFAPSHIRYSPDRPPENAGSQRLLDAAAAGARHDRALWTPLAAATGAAGNSTALVGTPETVAQALLDYIEIGVTTVLIRGYDPYDDAVEYGRSLLPLVRAEVDRRDAQPSPGIVGTSGTTMRPGRPPH